MPTDLFNADLTTVAGVARAGEAEINFTDQNDNAISMPASSVKLSYQEKVSYLQLPNGKVMLVAQMPVGHVSIGALLGDNLSTFLSTFGPLCQAGDAANKLKIQFVADASCTSSFPLADSVMFTCQNVKISQFGANTSVKGVAVQVGLELFALNIQLNAVT